MNENQEKRLMIKDIVTLLSEQISGMLVRRRVKFESNEIAMGI